MPTRARPAFAQHALACFLAQTWPDKELIILDDFDARSFTQAPDLPGVRYSLSEMRLTIGAKRNRCCELALGKVIAHWDDDDISEPKRIEDQIDRLISTGAMVTGYNSMDFERPDGSIQPFNDNEKFALGTSLMYRPEYWLSRPFRNLNAGEDDIFRWKAVQDGTLATAPADGLMRARIHPGNTVPKVTTGHRWKENAA